VTKINIHQFEAFGRFDGREKGRPAPEPPPLLSQNVSSKFCAMSLNGNLNRDNPAKMTG
jgi:hypothetical protein